MVQFVGALERRIDPAYDCRNRIRRIQRLVGIHLAGEIGIPGNLPA
jgi:hypothetical protein